jgi:hypothetical protein
VKAQAVLPSAAWRSAHSKADIFRFKFGIVETPERCDGRSTPVHGEYAWFRREAFDLTIIDLTFKIARRPSEVLAVLTGDALPLEGVLDLRVSMNYQFMGGGTRAVKLRVPKNIAQNFHFEGPQIAERSLADDVWTVTFQKELTGPPTACGKIAVSLVSPRRPLPRKSRC